MVRATRRGTALVMAVACLLATSCSGNKEESVPDGGSSGARIGLKVSESAARSCEAVLVDPDRAVKTMVFGSGVEGRFLREGARLSAAFLSRADAAPAVADLGLELVPAGSSANLSVQLAHCFDRDGKLLANATVELVR